MSKTILPPQTGSSGKFLKSDGTDATWEDSGLSAHESLSASTSAKGHVQLSTSLSSTSSTLASTASATKAVNDNLIAHEAVSASTSAKGHVQLTSSLTSTSTSLAATASAAKSLKDAINAITNSRGGTSKGWFKDEATGIILQWGAVTPNSAEATSNLVKYKTINTTFAIAFPNACLQVIATGWRGNIAYSENPSKTGCRIGQASVAGSFEDTPVSYLAIGY